MDTFKGLVFADILVVANSAFSYVAGLYNRGTVYYVYREGGSFKGPDRYPSRKPLPSWTPLK